MAPTAETTKPRADALRAPRPAPPPRVAALNRRLDAETKRRRQVFKTDRLATAEVDHRQKQGTMLPTPERADHGKFSEAQAFGTETDPAAIAGRRVRRSQSPIDRYLAHKQIKKRQAVAADKLRDDWEFGFARVHSSDKGMGGGGGVPEYSHAQLAAARRYTEAMEGLHPRIRVVVLAVVIGSDGGGEVTIAALADMQRETLRRRDPTAKVDGRALFTTFSLGLDMLADHYGLK